MARASTISSMSAAYRSDDGSQTRHPLTGRSRSLGQRLDDRTRKSTEAPVRDRPSLARKTGMGPGWQVALTAKAQAAAVCVEVIDRLMPRRFVGGASGHPRPCRGCIIAPADGASGTAFDWERSQGADPAVSGEPPKPAVPVKESITDDYLISLEDGRKLKSMKRYLAGLGMTPADYRAKWGLPHDYPMVAPAYAAHRSVLAKAIGLGRSRRGRGRRRSPRGRAGARRTQEGWPRRQKGLTQRGASRRSPTAPYPASATGSTIVGSSSP